MAVSEARRIGIIGIGLLGTAIAERLLGCGDSEEKPFELIGFDSSSNNLSNFQSLGGRPAKDSTDVIQQCERVVLCLPDALAVANVVAEIEPALRSNQTIVDTTTCGPDDTISVGNRLAETQVEYLDATISGSSEQMRNHEATLLVGGSDAAFARCEDLFDALSRKVYHLGAMGSGSKMKLITNLAIGLNRAVLAESLALGERCGFEPSVVVDVLRNTPAHSAAMDTKGQKMAESDYSPQARLRQHYKDVKLILDLATTTQASVPLSDLHANLLAELISEGHGDQDNSVIIEAFRKNR